MFFVAVIAVVSSSEDDFWATGFFACVNLRFRDLNMTEYIRILLNVEYENGTFTKPKPKPASDDEQSMRMRRMKLLCEQAHLAPDR